MKKITISTEILAVTYDELNDEERLLIDFARDANKRSYAPYSKFCVGAAIKLDNGEIITGANQENVHTPRERAPNARLVSTPTLVSPTRISRQSPSPRATAAETR